MEKAALTGKMNMHHLLTTVPLGTGQVEGGEVNFCTWLKFSLFFSVSLWGRDQKRPMEFEAESMRKLKKDTLTIVFAS